MKFIVVIGLVSSVANIFIYSGNDAAMWGWLSSSAWCLVALINELAADK
jgi:hypothetical protein